VCKKLIKNSQPFGKKFQKTAGGDFLTHTVRVQMSYTAWHHNICPSSVCRSPSYQYVNISALSVVVT